MDNSILDAVRDVPSSRAYSPADTTSADSGCDKSSMRLLVIAAAILLILVIVYYIAAPRGLSHRLAKHGWILFVRDGCGYCTKQMKVLGGSYSKLVECAPGGSS